MDTTYIYAGTRAKAMERKLLTDTQLELLLSAKSVDEVHKVLQDTFLASYISKHSDLDIISALDQSIVDAKKTLASIAPEPDLLNILWIKYDYHNLKTIIKGKKVGSTNDTILKDCFLVGRYSPEYLLKAYEDNKLSALNSHLEDARNEAESATNVYEIDLAMNKFYFKTIRAISNASKDNFTKDLVTLLIDTFNIVASLRADLIDSIDKRKVFIPGGSLHPESIETSRDALESVKRFGGEKRWAHAIDMYEKHGTYTELEKAADEYVSDFYKERSRELFSPAPLFGYFTAKKNNAQIIGAILTAKKSGMSEKDLRTILRRLHA